MACGCTTVAACIKQLRTSLSFSQSVFWPSILQEHLQHRGDVVEVLYSPDGLWLYSAGADGVLSVYDVQQVYTPVKCLAAGAKNVKVRAGG